MRSKKPLRASAVTLMAMVMAVGLVRGLAPVPASARADQPLANRGTPAPDAVASAPTADRPATASPAAPRPPAD